MHHPSATTASATPSPYASADGSSARPSLRRAHNNNNSLSRSALNNNSAGAVPAAVDRKRPALSMRLVISLFFAVTVLVVSSVTFTITYLTSLDTVEDVGRSYATSLATTARSRTEMLFHVPGAGALSLAQELKRFADFRLPTEDPTTWTVLEFAMNALARTFLLAPDDTFLCTILFDDGSRASVGAGDPFGVGERMMSLTSLHAGSINQSSPTRCCGTPRQDSYFLSNMSRWPFAPRSLQPLTDSRIGLYVGVRGLLVNRVGGLWNRVTFNNVVAVPSFAVGLAMPVRNQSDDFLGVYIGSISTAQIERFLLDLDVTPNTVAFALDGDAAVVATTHPYEYRSFTNTTDAGEIVPVNCFNTANLNPSAAVHVIACRTFARDFPYAPLQAVADDSRFTRPSATAAPVAETVDTKAEGTTIAVSAGVSSSIGLLPIALLIFMPQADILGPIIETRNVVIGIVVGIIVIATLSSFAFTAHVLGALDRVAAQMRQTAKLRDRHNDTAAAAARTDPAGGSASDDDSPSVSGLAEIYDIQRAYGDMAVAIGSFTRYVPRDVVRDLLRSGELCALAMAPRRCTMLFSDIQGFTTMCERVPAADLSELVHGYFERMTRLVGSHGGIVDKFIGDAVMAVWGAPFAIGNAELRATLCGLRMTRETRVAPLAPLFDAAGEVLRIRVGVATGDVLAGNMGSAERMSYTVIGDAVNLASRLESFCKQVGVEMLVCEATAAAVDEAVTLRLLMKLRVKGKLEGVCIFHPLGTQSRLLPPDLIDGLKAEDAMGMSDSQSVVFSVSAISDTASQRAAAGEHISMRGETTLALYEAAGRLEPDSLVADDDVKAAATAFSQAATAFMRADFSRTLAILGDAQSPIQRHFAPGIDGGDGDPVHRQLHDEAERNLQCPNADFDGTITAQEK